MDDTAPATKANLASLEQSIQAKLRQLELSVHGKIVRIEGTFEERISSLEKSIGIVSAHLVRHDERFDRLHEDNTRILDVLVNVQQRQDTKLQNHERRIVNLEAAAV